MAISTEIVDNEDFLTLFGSIQLSISALRGETLGQTLVSMEKGRGDRNSLGKKPVRTVQRTNYRPNGTEATTKLEKKSSSSLPYIINLTTEVKLISRPWVS